MGKRKKAKKAKEEESEGFPVGMVCLRLSVCQYLTRALTFVHRGHNESPRGARGR